MLFRDIKKERRCYVMNKDIDGHRENINPRSEQTSSTRDENHTYRQLLKPLHLQES